MHFRDFNAIAAELHDGDLLLIRLLSHQQINGAVAGPIRLGSPAQPGFITVTVDDTVRQVMADEIETMDLIG